MNDLLNFVAETFQQCFYDEYKTRLIGGFEEPEYIADVNGYAEIRYRYDYIRSALHEIAHWCIAGNERRKHNDYGYWYEPDGRNAEQQKSFYHIEVKPQAVEWGICLVIGIAFEVSVDNLHAELVGMDTEKTDFQEKVKIQLACYQQNGFPERAEKLISKLGEKRKEINYG